MSFVYGQVKGREPNQTDILEQIHLANINTIFTVVVSC